MGPWSHSCRLLYFAERVAKAVVDATGAEVAAALTGFRQPAGATLTPARRRIRHARSRSRSAATARRRGSIARIRYWREIWVCSCCSTFSTDSEPTAWLGGYSLKVARNWPTKAWAGTKSHIWSPSQRV